ncbi:hypothetical protein [Rhizobium leguminosarum]|uniref:hypothetical protein n=1 Tax=Rhizobium leguminosarum TaxID=384 RepID=UPI0016124BA0|nr:hypothetical protein [Rhizobium leguminosarum]MBB4345197.1 hypothetical protein [Rhizobium leguminosarum]MBB6298268.1 hypothetical protein [Rhizobium leguminosarum]
MTNRALSWAEASTCELKTAETGCHAWPVAGLGMPCLMMAAERKEMTVRVDVYWNVKQGCFSIRHKGVVIAHASTVLIRDPEYVVQKAGRARVLASGQKEVHAFVRGHLEACQGEETYAARSRGFYCLWTGMDNRYRKFANQTGRDVTYNPLKVDTFMVQTRDGSGGFTLEPIAKGELALLRKGTIMGRKGKPVVIDFDPCQMPEGFR